MELSCSGEKEKRRDALVDNTGRCMGRMAAMCAADHRADTTAVLTWAVWARSV
jgi:hypothetical protein